MSKPDTPFQVPDVTRVKHILDQAIGFALIDPQVVASHDASCVLASMLQHRQRIIDVLVYVAVANDSYDSTHEAESHSKAIDGTSLSEF